MTFEVDLNCDMGESLGPWPMGDDAAVLPHVTSANIACGLHAGDALTMRRTVRLARQHGVALGAHPGFPDLVGFGRREMRIAPAEVEALVLYQVGALAAVAAAEGGALAHVKPHGALYNLAAQDAVLASAIAGAVSAFDRRLVLFALAGSVALEAGRRAGLHVAAEGFADRAYAPDGSLVSRSKPGSVITDPALVVRRAVRMVREQTVTAIDGTEVRIAIDTICIHGDTPGAAALARAVREGLQREGILVRATGAGSAA